jgi:hypothetical protein
MTLHVTNVEHGERLSTDKSLRELDRREDSGSIVELLYSAFTCAIYVRLTEKQSGDILVGLVPNAEARWAFDHPYMYV